MRSKRKALSHTAKSGTARKNYGIYLVEGLPLHQLFLPLSRSSVFILTIFFFPFIVLFFLLTNAGAKDSHENDIHRIAPGRLSV